eukprot:1862697-Pyramimonas_sp.AAC.1
MGDAGETSVAAEADNESASERPVGALDRRLRGAPNMSRTVLLQGCAAQRICCDDCFVGGGWRLSVDAEAALHRSFDMAPE